MKTSWPQVAVAVAAGYAVCFQLGKVPAALPLIGAEFGLSLWQRGVIISSLSVLTAVSGIFIGLWANQYRAERTAVLALGIAVAAGVAGSYSTDFVALLVTRLLEGLGYILAMAALPAVVSANATPDDRPLALAFWGSTVPGGMAVLMLSSPVLMESAGLGWRGLWIVTAAAIGAIALVFFVSVRAQSDGKRPSVPPMADLKHAMRFSTLALVGLFILYSVQFLAVVSFLPTLLVEQSELSLTTAAFFSGIVAIGNAAGSVLAGPLIKFGIRRRNIIIAGYVLMALSAAIVMVDLFPVPVRISAAIGFSTAGALIPGTIWTFVPELAERPTQAPIFAGMFIQGSGIGQITGPVLLGGLVDVFGRWDAAVLLTTGASALGIVLALLSQARAPTSD